MIVAPKKVSQEGFIKNITNPEEQIQQNWIDLTLWSISAIYWTNTLTKQTRSHADRTLLGSLEEDWEMILTLAPGQYEILYNETFDIPNWYAAFIYSRSTVIRWGNFLASGLYDAGFKWIGGGVLHITQPTTIQLGVRIGQVVFWNAEEGDLYNGIYNNAVVA